MPHPEQPVFYLAFDHRGEFARSVLDADADALDAEQVRTIRHAKTVIFDAAIELLDRDASHHGTLGVLTDEEYASPAALEALDRRIVVAMPVEAPDRAVFDFAYGDDWRSHIQRFDPTFAKVLVRYNVEGSAEDNAVQRDRLRELSAWLADRDTGFMFELIVPPTPAQSARPDYESQQRPGLIQRAIAELQEAGIEPDTWKLEGIDSVEDARRVAAQARSTDSRDHVTCIVLGAGQSNEQVLRWIRVAAEVDGYAGFAIGRSIWKGPIRKHLSGALTAAAASSLIADRYLEFVHAYLGALTLDEDVLLTEGTD